MHIDQRIHFGSIGLKIGDRIECKLNNDEFIVSSGNGTSGNGGTLIKYTDENKKGNYGIKYLTRIMLGGTIPENIDYWSLWTYNGRTLREIFEEKGL